MRAFSLNVLSKLLLACLCGLALAAHAVTLTVAIDRADNRPFEYVDDHGKLTGFHIEVVRLVATRLGWSVRFEPMSWDRALRKLELGEVDAVSYLPHSPAHERYAVFRPDNMLHVQRVGVYIQRSRASEIAAEPLAGLMRHWRVGVVRNYYYNDEIAALLARGVPADRRAASQAALMRLLLAGRVDAAVLVGSALHQARAKLPDLDQRIQRLDNGALAGSPVYLAFSKQRQGDAQAAQFAQAFAAWRGLPEYQWLAQRFGVLPLLPNAPQKSAG